MKSNEIQYLNEVFSLSTPIPPPLLSASFMNLIPPIDTSIFKSKNITEEQVLKNLRLRFSDRFPALSVIAENKYSINSSESGKTFTAIFILQSISPPFLNCVTNFEPEFFNMFLDLLRYANKIAPQFSELNIQSFSYLYQKVIIYPQFIVFIPNITKYIQKTVISPQSCFVPQVLCLKRVLSLLLSTPSTHSLSLFSTNIMMMISFFKVADSKSQNYDDLNEIYELIFKFYSEFTTIYPQFAQNQDYIDLKGTFIRIGLELNRVTSVPFKQYLNIILPSINKPIISNNEYAQKVAAISEVITKSPEELIKTDEINNAVDFNSYSIPAIDDVETYIKEIEHPLLSLQDYVSLFSEQTCSSFLELIISEGYAEFKKGNLPLQTFLFIELFGLNDVSNISSYISQSKAKPIFFTESLFEPSINMFRSPKSKLLTIRALMFKVMEKLIEASSEKPFFISIIQDALLTNAHYPELFAEILYFSCPLLIKYSKSLDSQLILLKCIADAIQFQQTSKFLDHPYHKELRSITFDALRQIFEMISNSKPKTYQVSPILHNILAMIFESSVSNIIFILIEKYFSIFFSTEPQIIVALFNETISFFDFCLNNISVFLKPFNRLLAVYFKALCGLSSPSQIEALKNTEFFDKVHSAIFIEGIDIDTIAYSLVIIHFAPRKRSEARWPDIVKIASKFEISESMYEAVLIVLSHNEEPFIGIANQNAIDLIPLVLNSKYGVYLLSKIHSCLLKSIPDRILFSELGLVNQVIKILKEDSSDEIWNYAMQIVQLTFTYSTRRMDLCAFFRLLSPLSENKRTKHGQKILSVLVDLVTQRPVSYRSIIRFSSRNGYIKTPIVPVKKWTSGFTISMNLMVSNLQNPNDSIKLFKLNNGSSFVSADLRFSSVNITTSFYNQNCVIDIDFPMNKWFVISVSFVTLDYVFVYVNGKAAGSQNLSIPNIEWPESFNENMLFGGEGQGFVECHLSRAAIFSNAPNTNAFPDISVDEGLLSDARTCFLVDSKSYIKGKLHNLAHSSTTYFEFTGQLLPNISAFNSTFDFSKGLAFVISLFSQIDFESAAENFTNNHYFIELLELLCVLIQMSDSVQEKLVNLYAFEIIAHFMYHSTSIEMDFNLSSSIFKIHPCLRNKKLLASFVRSILLNFPLWKSSSIPTLKELFKAWLLSTNFMPDVLTKELRPQIVLNVIKTLYEADTINDEIKAPLFDILIRALCIECTSQDLAMIISVMKLRKNMPNEINEYLLMLDRFITKSPTQIKGVSHALIMTEWVVLYPDPKIQLTLIRYFFQSDINLLVQFVLKNIEASSWKETGINDSLLVKGCCTFANTECETIEEIIKNREKWEINELLLPMILVSSFFASNEVCSQFSKFLQIVFSLKGEKIVVIKESINDFNLLLLTIYAIFKSQESIEFLLALISLDPQLCSKTFKMIDVFTLVSHEDFHDFQLNLASKLIFIVFDKDFAGDRNQYLDILTNFSCYHTRINIKKKGNTNSKHLMKLIGNLKKKPLNLPQYSFCLSKIEGNVWVDKIFVLQFLKQISGIKGLKMHRFFMLLSFVCHPNLSHEKLPKLLDRFVSKVNVDSKAWIPVIYQVSRHPKDFETATEFMTAFGQKLKPSTEMYDHYCEYFAKFINDFTFEPPISQQISNSIHQNLSFDDSADTKTEAAIEDVRRNTEEIQHNYEGRWYRLKRTVSYYKSPFYYVNSPNVYKRGNYFDLNLKPSIFLRRSVKENDELRNKKRGTIRRRNSVPTFDTDFDAKKDGKQLSSRECEKIEFNKIVKGFLYVTSSGYKFVSHSLKVTRINSATITHIFWSWSQNGANSFQIFLKTRHCYLFRFPNEKSHSFVKNMKKFALPNIFYFQDNSPDQEIERIQITNRWINNKMSNFDYILWLNYLSGKSFLNKNAYPIFPRIFEGDNETKRIVDFSASVKPPNSSQIFGGYLGIIEPFKSLSAGVERVKSFDKIDTDIPPEFYINEEYYQDMELPKWAPTKIELLREMRKTLESEEISEKLHIWIDKVFGVHQDQTFNFEEFIKYSDLIPQELFKEPHPQRNKPHKKANEKVDKLFKIANLASAILDYCVAGRSLADCSVYVLLSDGQIVQVYLNPPVPSSSQPPQNPPPFKQINKNVNFVAFSTNKFFYSYGSFIGLYDLDRRTCNLSQSDPVVSKVTAIATCDGFSATGCKDGSVILWNTRERPSFSSVLLVHRNAIKCIALSTIFGVCVSCDVKGQIAISLLPNLEVIRTIKLSQLIPKKVIITEGNGCACISGEFQGEPYLAICTLNGQFIKQEVIKNKINDICCLVSESGIDYIVVADNGNNIDLYDAYLLKFVKHVHQLKMPIRQIKYSADIQAFVLTTSYAEAPIVIIPFVQK